MATKLRTNPRKYASQDRSRLTVDALLEATARILVKEGYDRASTNRIADAAGVSVGSLYQYFPSKEALVAALIEQHSASMLAFLETMAATTSIDTPLGDVVREVVQAMIDAHK